MIVKQEIIQLLEDKHVTHIFHLPGIHTLPLNEVLTNSKITVLMGRHESTCGFMADGYARATGQTAVVVITPGPGLGNVTAACMEAFGSDSPLLLIHVDTERTDIGKGILHELKDPDSMFRDITKHVARVDRPGDTAPVLSDAFDRTQSNRPGPVMVSVPYTFFEKKVSSSDYPPTPRSGGTLSSQGPLEELLKNARHPVIVAGRSCMSEAAGTLLDRICVRSSIPLVTSTAGKGVVPEDRPYAFGNVMQKGIVREMINEADVVIAAGTRLRDVDARRRGVKIRNLVHVDLDGSWIDKNYRSGASLSGDPIQSLQQIEAILSSKRSLWNLSDLRERYNVQAKSLSSRSPGYRIIQELRRVIPPETLTFWDLNLMAYWAEYHFPIFRQNTFFMPRGASPIFFALPAAMGGVVGVPGRPCLAVCGDGGILPVIGELATIVQYRLPLVILVYNNGAYGILEDYMSATYHLDGVMTLKNPDYVALARAFGIKAKRATTPAGLTKIFAADVRWDEPFLIEFRSPLFPPPWRL